MKNKICLLFLSVVIVIAGAAIHTAAAQDASPFAEFNKNADKGTIYASIKHGAGEGEVGSFLENKTAETVLLGPSAFCADAAGNLFLVDCVNSRVVKYDAAQKKSSVVFDYKTSGIKNGFVSDIAVAASGDIYLVNAAESYIYRFSSAGKFLGVIGQIEDRHVAKRIAAIFCDASSNLIVIDAQNPNAVVFSPDGKIIKETEIKFEDASAYAIDASGKPFASRLGASGALLVDIETGTETLLKYELDAKKEDKLVEARLIGFDAAGAAYLKMIVINKEGGMVNNDIVKFKNAAGEKSLKVPYYTIDEQELTIKKPEIFLKENMILGYYDSEISFDVVSYEIK
jgi:hypothetical protein